MQGIVSGQVRNYIAYFIFFVSIVMLAITYHVGTKQDVVYLDDYKNFAKAHEMIEKGIGREAIPLLSDLSKNYSDSFIVFWKYGQALALEENFPLAIEQYASALEIRPALVVNPEFMVNFGEAYYKINDYKMAKVYLDAAHELELSYNLSKTTESMLRVISMQNEREGGL